MDIFDTCQLILTVILTLFIWMYPDTSRPNKLIFGLVILSISLFVANIKSRFMYHKLKSSHEKIREKHQALSQQYQDKQNELALTHRECAQEIRRYQSAFTSIEALILSTAQTTASNRLSTMTTYFEKIKNSLWDVEGDSDKR